MDSLSLVSLDAEQLLLIHGAKEYTFKSMVIPELPKEDLSVFIYAAEHYYLPAGGKEKLVLVPFNQGAHGRMAKPELPQGLATNVPIYYQSKKEDFLSRGS